MSLTLTRASLSRSAGGDWSEDDYDVVCDGNVVGRIFYSAGSPQDATWFWGIEFHLREGSGPHQGYAPDREAALVALSNAWDEVVT
jgi:hypothetical protein